MTRTQFKISLTLVRYDSVVAPDVYFCHVYGMQTELTLTTMSSKHLLLSSQKKNLKKAPRNGLEVQLPHRYVCYQSLA